MLFFSKIFCNKHSHCILARNAISLVLFVSAWSFLETDHSYSSSKSWSRRPPQENRVPLKHALLLIILAVVWSEGSRLFKELNDSLPFAVCIFKGVVACFCSVQFPSVPAPPPSHRTFMSGLETNSLWVMRLPQKMGTDSEEALLGNKVEQSVLPPVNPPHTHTHTLSFCFVSSPLSCALPQCWTNSRRQWTPAAHATSLKPHRWFSWAGLGV